METNNGNNSKAVVALVLGILSIVLALLYWWAGVILGIIGIVLGAKARKETPCGMATAGFVCSIIGLVLGCLSIVCVLCALGALGSLAAAGAAM